MSIDLRVFFLRIPETPSEFVSEFKPEKKTQPLAFF